MHKNWYQIINKKRNSVLFWLILSLGFAVLYGIFGLQRAFNMEYVVQKDAREYVFWMQRFIDPDILPHDLIADYFQSITPVGYAAIYKLMATLGCHPLFLSKILPIVLGLVTTIYSFYLSLELFPVAATGFISSLLLNQSLWFKDDLVSATPRAFIYPLLLAFFYYFLRQSWVIVGVIIVLEGFLYPPLLLISIGILVWQFLTSNYGKLHSNYLWLATFLILGLLSIIPYILASSQFGPVVTAAQAATMPEHWLEGRHPFFDPNPWRFWLIGQHSGILPPLMPPFIWLGLFFPLVYYHQTHFPLMNLLKSKVSLLISIVVVSVILYFVAHGLMLRLFFPSRYTVHTFRIVMSMLAGITLTVILDRLFNSQSHSRKRRGWEMGLALVLVGILVIYPQVSGRFPTTGYKISGESALYQFLQQQPKDSLIASLSEEVDNIPTFAQRSILVGKEYALPFHLKYYSQIRQRTIDLISAQYSRKLAVVQQLIQKYSLKFWLLEYNTFKPEFLTDKTWLKSFQPAYTEALSNLQNGENLALDNLTKQCSVLQSKNFTLLSADCILRSRSSQSMGN